LAGLAQPSINHPFFPENAMKHSIALALSASLLVGASLLGSQDAAAAKRVTDFADQSFSASDVVSALAPRHLTRGLTIGEDESATRKISMQLRFARNSAELTAEAKRRLDVVASALKEAELADAKLIVSGHTDVTGRYERNLELSRARAEAVKAYLVTVHEIAAERLRAIGRGPNELLDESHPTSPVNRRVQLAVAA
jgi:outer membrane protein OmpA-like peptidoglycan-associated protein